VIKVEEPQGGDYARGLSPELFELVNRGKKSVTLDLRQEAGRAQFLQLARSADVVLETFRPGVMDKLGCGYAVLKQLNPRLVMAALTGYGQTGPYRDRPGHDLNYRGYAGELEQNGAAGAPPAAGNFQVADLAGGALTCAVGILAALLGARASGVGSFVDVGMLDGTLALQVLSMAALRASGQAQPRGADFLSGGLPNYAVYECADGKHLALGAVEAKFFHAALHAAGRPDLARLPLQPGPSPLRRELEALFKTRPRDQWERDLAHLETCVSAVLTPAEALQNEQVRARGMVQQAGGKPAAGLPIRFDRELPPLGPSPRLGADNAELLG
jgi:alpha-methylacyl-CoA racemase